MNTASPKGHYLTYLHYARTTLAILQQVLGIRRYQRGRQLSKTDIQNSFLENKKWDIPSLTTIFSYLKLIPEMI